MRERGESLESNVRNVQKVSKDCMNYLQWVVINSNFSYFLLVSLLVGSQFL